MSSDAACPAGRGTPHPIRAGLERLFAVRWPDLHERRGHVGPRTSHGLTEPATAAARGPAARSRPRHPPMPAPARGSNTSECRARRSPRSGRERGLTCAYPRVASAPEPGRRDPDHVPASRRAARGSTWREERPALVAAPGRPWSVSPADRSAGFARSPSLLAAAEHPTPVRGTPGPGVVHRLPKPASTSHHSCFSGTSAD
jgi:hypothetical protein